MEKAEDSEGCAERNASVVAEVAFLLFSVRKGLRRGEWVFREENGYLESLHKQ